MTTPIDIRADHLRIVQDVLRRHLPDGVKVWVFGSRATWATKDSSDLDLALEGDGEIPPRSLSALEAAFEDSDLPYAVDVVDVNRIGRRFRRIVEQQRVGLPQSAGRRSTDRRNGPPAHWPDTWCGKTIEDIAASSPNAVVGGPFGSNLVSRDYVRDGVPVIRGQNMGARWVTGDFVFVTPEKAASLKVNLARPGDVVLTQRGTLGQVSIVPSALPRCLVSQSQMKVTVDREVADPQFLYYVLSSAEQQAYVRQNAIQTGVPHTNLGILRSTPIPVPPVTEQRAIAHILGTLDDKIELNRRMNATLEAMARALFRSWFVDFDPVRAKMEGRDTGLPKDIADLFPDRLVDSELGEIPRGWPVETLADHFEAVKGVSYKGSGLGGDGAPLHNLNSVHEGGGYKYEGIKFYSGEYAERHRVQPGDVVVANTEQGHERLLIGYAAIVPEFFGTDGIASHHIYRLRSRRARWLSTRFLLFLLNSARMHDLVSGYANGTTVNMLPVDGVQRPPIAVPPRALAKTFDIVASCSERRREQIVRESRTLTSLRDTLLPKLVSGEIRLRDVEKFVGAIA